MKFKKNSQHLMSDATYQPFHLGGDGKVCAYTDEEKQRVRFKSKKEVEEFLDNRTEEFYYYVEVRSMAISYIPEEFCENQKLKLK